MEGVSHPPRVWYYAIDDNKIVPLSLDQLKQALAVRQNPRDVRVWREGFSKWIRAGDELKTALPPPPPTNGSLHWEGWYYYADENDKIGPLNFEQLNQALAARKNPKDLFVWC